MIDVDRAMLNPVAEAESSQQIMKALHVLGGKASAKSATATKHGGV